MNAIEIAGLSKRFRLQHDKSLKERMLSFGRRSGEEFYALRDIDVAVEAGTTLGLLGHNGSGKSTLLKCVAGILAPSTGTVTVAGRVAALLELGAGFQPDLTGRENVYLNGAILGLAKREIDRRFDEIVAFSELEQFIDSQVKHYSSGMYVRLGFAVAVNVDPDVLLVDEVLAVGDEAFQRKCIERVRQFQSEGRTIVFVTHAPDLVRQICDRAVVLDHGRVVHDGAPGDAVRAFRERLFAGGSLQVETFGRKRERHIGKVQAPPARVLHPMEVKRNLKVRIADVRFEYPGAAEGRDCLLPHESLRIVMRYEAPERVDDVMFGLAVHEVGGTHVFGSNTKILGVEVPAVEGTGEVVYTFADVPLLDGTYLVSLSIQTYDEAVVYDWREQQYQFEVMHRDGRQGLVALPLSIDVHGEQT